MKYREVSKKLKALGCEELPRRGAGSHRVWHNLKNGKIAPLPDWGRERFETWYVTSGDSSIGIGLERVYGIEVIAARENSEIFSELL